MSEAKLDAPAGSAFLSPKEAKALALFGTEWADCPFGIHIKTLVALIRKDLIEWEDKLPFIGPEFFQWKINCRFRKKQNTAVTDAKHSVD